MNDDQNRALLRIGIRGKRHALEVLQHGPHHPRTFRAPPRQHFYPERGITTATVCKKCPHRRACRILSVELAEMESRLLSGSP